MFIQPTNVCKNIYNQGNISFKGNKPDTSDYSQIYKELEKIIAVQEEDIIQVKQPKSTTNNPGIAKIYKKFEEIGKQTDNKRIGIRIKKLMSKCPNAKTLARAFMLTCLLIIGSAGMGYGIGSTIVSSGSYKNKVEHPRNDISALDGNTTGVHKQAAILKMAAELEQTGTGDIEVENYDNGNLKSKKYYGEGISVYLNFAEDGHLDNTWLYVARKNISEKDYYYPNGNLGSSNDMNKHTFTGYREDGTIDCFKRYKKNDRYWVMTSFGLRDVWDEVEEKLYYPNGNIKSHWVEDGNKVTMESFYENGNPETYKVTKGGKTAETKEYYRNGNLKKSTIRKKNNKVVIKTYDENGKLLNKTVK